MKKIGMVVAVELESVISKYGEPTKQENKYGFEVLTYNFNNAILYVVHCGVGEIAAAAATQFCIGNLNCEMIINFGVVGGLTREMSVTKTCIVEKIVHYDFDCSYDDPRYVPGQYSQYDDEYIPTCQDMIDKALKIETDLKTVTLASGDKFVGEAMKKDLHDKFDADICDMEGAAVALTCNRNNVPFLMIKCVSDGCDGAVMEFQEYLKKSGDICIEIVDKIIRSF